MRVYNKMIDNTKVNGTHANTCLVSLEVSAAEVQNVGTLTSLTVRAPWLMIHYLRDSTTCALFPGPPRFLIQRLDGTLRISVPRQLCDTLAI